MTIRISKKLVFLALGLCLLAGVYYVTVRMVPDRTRAFMARHGFATADIGTTAFRGDSFVSRDIKLDPDAFSTLGALRVQPDWTGLFGGDFLAGIIIDDLRLLGEYENGKLDIAGWVPRLPPFPRQRDIILNGARLDLDTALGAIRIESKGRLSRQADRSYKAEIALFGRQHQLTFDSQWVGTFAPDGTYAFEGEINEATIRAPHLEASRMAGWLQFASGEQDGKLSSVLPVVAGQIQMGRLSFNGVPLGDVKLTLDGKLSALHVLMTAQVPGLPDSQVTADIRRDGMAWIVTATVSMTEAKDMLGFMVMLRQNLDAHEANTLTSFLITPGNIERLRRELAKISFDTLELNIEGPLHALHGALVAKTAKDGRIERYAISLDPGGQR